MRLYNIICKISKIQLAKGETMDRKNANEKKNNYLIPTVVVAVLLVISLSLLLIFFFGAGDDNSVSKGNVVGSANSVMALAGSDARLAAAKAPGFMRYVPSILTHVNQEKMTLAWWTGNDAEKSFTVSNLMPGDVEVKEYKLKINSNRPNHIYLDIAIDTPTVLSEVLLLKIEVGEDLIYEGPFNSEIGQLTYNISRAETDEFTYKFTVSLPTSAGNRYAGKSLDADFIWSFDETVVFPSNPSSRPIIATSFDSISAVGQKTVEGDTPETAETFSFLLEFKNMLGKYEPVGTVSCDGEGKIDFTDLMSSFSFERIGLYEFRITEVAGTTDGMEYDSSEKHFQMFFGDSDQNGKLEILEFAGVSGVSVAHDEKTDEYSLSFEFVNVFKESSGTETEPHPGVEPGDEDKELEIVIKIENEVEGSESGDAEHRDEEFAFVIENVDTGEKKIVVTDDKGKAEFVLEFDESDVGTTNRYKVSAIAGSDPLIEYSDKVYEITVTVSKDPITGELSATVTLDGVTVLPEDINLSFVTVSNYEQGEEIEDLVPEITVTATLLVIETALFGYMLGYKKKRFGVRLHSFAAPVIFLGSLVPLWQTVVLVALVILTLAMLAVDVVYYVHLRQKIKEQLSEEADDGQQ